MLFTSGKENIYNVIWKEIIIMFCSQETIKTTEGKVPRQGVEVFET